MLRHVTEFAILINEDTLYGQTEWGKALGEGCRVVLRHLPDIQELHCGLFGDRDFDLSMESWKIQINLHKALLSGYFANLSHFNLYSGIIQVNQFLAFLRRHQQTLKTLRMRDCIMYREMTAKGTPGRSLHFGGGIAALHRNAEAEQA
jgi:hypothetical protein